MKDCHALLHSARNDSTLIHIVIARKNDEAIYQHITGISSLVRHGGIFCGKTKEHKQKKFIINLRNT
jgi:hypothetical protein